MKKPRWFDQMREHLRPRVASPQGVKSQSFLQSIPPCVVSLLVLERRLPSHYFRTQCFHSPFL